MVIDDAYEASLQNVGRPGKNTQEREMEEKTEIIGATVMAVVSAAGNMLTEEHRQIVENIKEMDWVPIDVVLGVISGVVAADPEKARTLGRTVPYAIKPKMVELGAKTPIDAVRAMEMVHTMTTRGPKAGYLEVKEQGDNHVVVAETTPYDCLFEEGVFLGAVRAFGGKNVQAEHLTCVKNGDAECLHKITWE